MRSSGQIHAQLSKRVVGATSTSMSVLNEADAIALAVLPANQRYFAEVLECGGRHAATDEPRLKRRPAPAPEGWLRCTLLHRYHLRAAKCCII